MTYLLVRWGDFKKWGDDLEMGWAAGGGGGWYPFTDYDYCKCGISRHSGKSRPIQTYSALLWHI